MLICPTVKRVTSASGARWSCPAITATTTQTHRRFCQGAGSGPGISEGSKADSSISRSRLRDLIIRGGENIYPFEIENRLEEHPDVVEVAAFGVEHDVLGQEVGVIVVVKAGSELSEDDLRQHCGPHFSSYKIPTYIELRLDPLPRNATGKVMKDVLVGHASNQFIEE